VDITKDTTTLYASDRDRISVSGDDTLLIEAGRLADGSPDLYFRGGSIAENREVGSKTLGIASFYLRAVCMNSQSLGLSRRRNFEEITTAFPICCHSVLLTRRGRRLTKLANLRPSAVHRRDSRRRGSGSLP